MFCLHVCVCTRPMEVRSRHQISQTWSFELPCMWVLEIEFRFSGRMVFHLFSSSWVFLVLVAKTQLKPDVSRKGTGLALYMFCSQIPGQRHQESFSLPLFPSVPALSFIYPRLVWNFLGSSGHLWTPGLPASTPDSWLQTWARCQGACSIVHRAYRPCIHTLVRALTTR